MKVPKARKLPSGKWRIQLRLDGKSVSITEDTERECARKAALLKAEFINGKKPESRDDITLTQAIDKFIADRSSVLSVSTIRGYRVAQKNYFQSAMNKRLDEIDWQREVNAMARNYAPKTVKNAYRFMCTVSREMGVEPKKVTLPQMIVKERPFLSKDEIVRFLAAIKNTPIEIPALLALHSLRRSEIAGLDWSNIDMDNKTITVSGSVVPDENNCLVYKPTNKNSASSRTVPIFIPELYTALKAVEDKNGKVCKYHPNSIYKAIQTVCRENGLPEVGIHGLRHTAVTIAYSAGVSEKSAMQMFGYSDFNTMRSVYTHLDKSARAEAISKMQNFLS